MTPEIRYCMTADGVRIAWSIAGNGPPLVVMPTMPFSHMRMEWEHPSWAAWLSRMATVRTVIRYDGRGTGSSQRGIHQYSLENAVADLDAVLTRAGVTEFDAWAPLQSSALGIRVAATRTDAVRRLIIWCGWTNAQQLFLSTQVQAVMSLADADQQVFLQTMARAIAGWDENEEAMWFTQFVSESSDLETAKLIVQADLDAAGDMAAVSAPTLVLHSTGLAWLPEETSRMIAASIPDARLTTIDGRASAWFTGDQEPLFAAIAKHLDEPSLANQRSAAADTPGTAAVLFMDIVDSTVHTELLGDAEYRDLSRGVDWALRGAITEFGGRAVEGKVLGDGVMAIFSSAAGAIRCALAAANEATNAGVALHLGIHAGDVLYEGDSVHGGTVNIAARIAALSGPNELLVSSTVRDLARTSAGVRFEPRGEQSLKGVAEPIAIFAARVAE